MSILRLTMALTCLTFALGCTQGKPPEEKKAGKAKKQEKADEWRTVEYGLAAVFERNKKLPFGDFVLTHTGTRRDALPNGDSVEFRVFKAAKDGDEVAVEWPVSSKQPVLFTIAGLDFLLEVDESSLADVGLEEGQLVVWTKGALAQALLGEKVAEHKRKKQGITEEEWQAILAEARGDAPAAKDKPADQEDGQADKPAEADEVKAIADPVADAPSLKQVVEEAKEEAPKAEVREYKREKKKKDSSRKREERVKRLTSNRSVAGLVGADFGVAGGAGGLGSGIVGGPTGAPGIPASLAEGVKPADTEHYDKVAENKFKAATEHPLSTFSIDVDTASYSNVRRFINQSRIPPADAVRIEELINYFSYDYELPTGEVPFAVETEISDCPWNDANRLVSIGLQGRTVDTAKLPPANLVFLLDVSGSMNRPNKLPLLQKALKLLVQQMREVDRIAIVVYAGAAGLVLPSTPCTNKQAIMQAMDGLRAGGSTAGGAGIKLAYEIAKKNFAKDGNNRVILATDGDFNVGTSSTDELTKLIEEKREDGIFLTVLGFGGGNYKGSKMEQLADKGNGNYAYIDNILEAKKVLVTEMGSTLLAIAKDVKLQIEFNPTKVKEYRLIGYENRMLKKEDFADDKKDAGELGAGHTVTALYEIVPLKEGEKVGDGELKYMASKATDEATGSGELMTVKLRYKAPDGDVSKLIEKPIKDDFLALAKTSDNFRFAAAVAEFGLLLRKSEFKGHASYAKVKALAEAAKGKDQFGYRAEFVLLVSKAELLAK